MRPNMDACLLFSVLQILSLWSSAFSHPSFILLSPSFFPLSFSVLQLRAVLHLISSSGYLSSFTHHVCLFVTPLLIELHWLPVAVRIKFKPLIIAYRVIAGSAPTYLNALVRANVTSTTRAGASLSTFMKLLKTQLFREHLPY